MSLYELAVKYALPLSDIAEQLDTFDDVIPGWAAGPVPGADNNPGGDEPHLLIQLYEHCGNNVVLIYGWERCVVYPESDAPYEITLYRVLEYLEQLPKPLRHFTK